MAFTGQREGTGGGGACLHACHDGLDSARSAMAELAGKSLAAWPIHLHKCSARAAALTRSFRRRARVGSHVQLPALKKEENNEGDELREWTTY